jgi:hypothetical protein
MITYDTALRIRINDGLKNTISDICNYTRINEADWVRSRLVNCARNDVANLEEVKQEFMWS